MTEPDTVSVREVAVRDITVRVAEAGNGPALLLLHGFPHTWEVWSRVIPALATRHRVIAPDLRGLGGSSRAGSGYDLESLSDDAIGLLDAVGVVDASVVALDAGAPIAFLTALRRPERVRRLVLMEAILGELPGAPAVKPWWFGFHAIPGLAEAAVEGNEDDYIGFFLDIGLVRDRMPAELRTAFIDAYRGRDSLRCGFEYYRALALNAHQITDAVATTRLTVPTLALGSSPVGSNLHAQLVPIADRLDGRLIDDCGHIIPLDRPDALLAAIEPFLAA